MGFDPNKKINTGISPQYVNPYTPPTIQNQPAKKSNLGVKILISLLLAVGLVCVGLFAAILLNGNFSQGVDGSTTGNTNSGNSSNMNQVEIFLD